jgi:hypothetical protein
MPRVGFEPTIPVFERAKTFHVLVRSATVIGTCGYSPYLTSSLTRGWIFRLQLLLGLASAVFLRE